MAAAVHKVSGCKSGQHLMVVLMTTEMQAMDKMTMQNSVVTARPVKQPSAATTQLG